MDLILHDGHEGKWRQILGRGGVVSIPSHRGEAPATCVSHDSKCWPSIGRIWALLQGNLGIKICYCTNPVDSAVYFRVPLFPSQGSSLGIVDVPVLRTEPSLEFCCSCDQALVFIPIFSVTFPSPTEALYFSHLVLHWWFTIFNISLSSSIISGVPHNCNPSLLSLKLPLLLYFLNSWPIAFLPWASDPSSALGNVSTVAWQACAGCKLGSTYHWCPWFGSQSRLDVSILDHCWH